MKKFEINKITDIVLFLYILSLYIFTYREGYYIISNGLALGFISLVFLKILINKKQVVYNKFLLFYILFILYTAISSLYSIDQQLAIFTTRTLILLFIVMLALINYVKSNEEIYKIINYFIYSGLIASIFVLITSDFSTIMRFGDELGNVNAIGMIISISFLFCFNKFYSDKKMIFLLFLIPMLSVILLTGSRKALLFVSLGTVMLFYFNNRKGILKKIKFLFLTLSLFILGYFLVFKIPIIYNVLGRRVENLWLILTDKSTTETSLNTRDFMIDYGFEKFKEKPLFGYGMDNYRALFNMDFSTASYAHNNYVEILVDLGVLGFLIFYGLHFIVLKDLFKTFEYNVSNNITFPFLVIIIAYLFLGTSLVYYDSKHFNILLVVASSIYTLNINKSKNHF